MDRWLQEEQADMEKFIHDCYENDEVWEEETGPMITYDALIDRFIFFWEGKVKAFESHESAEDWIRLNLARKKEG